MKIEEQLSSYKKHSDKFVSMALFFRKNPTPRQDMPAVLIDKFRYKKSSATVQATRLYWVDRNPRSRMALNRWLEGDKEITGVLIRFLATDPESTRKRKVFPYKEELRLLAIERDVYNEFHADAIMTATDFWKRHPDVSLKDIKKAFSRIQNKKM